MFTPPDDYAGRKVNEHAVFTNSEISLKHVNVYGFDFDYTLIHYTQELHRLIYEVARDRLVGMLNVSCHTCSVELIIQRFSRLAS